jgi:transposase
VADKLNKSRGLKGLIKQVRPETWDLIRAIISKQERAKIDDILAAAGAGRGRRNRDDLPVLLDMARMLTANPNLKPRAAAEKIVTQMGILSSNVGGEVSIQIGEKTVSLKSRLDSLKNKFSRSRPLLQRRLADEAKGRALATHYKQLESDPVGSPSAPNRVTPARTNTVKAQLNPATMDGFQDAWNRPLPPAPPSRSDLLRVTPARVDAGSGQGLRRVKPIGKTGSRTRRAALGPVENQDSLGHGARDSSSQKEFVIERMCLTDAQWMKMQPHCLGKATDPGCTGSDGRLFLEAVLWKVRTGSPWRDLPASFGNWDTVYGRFRYWKKRNVFKAIFEAVSGDTDIEYAMVDATIVRVHRDGQGAKGELKIRPPASPGAA